MSKNSMSSETTESAVTPETSDVATMSSRLNAMRSTRRGFLTQAGLMGVGALAATQLKAVAGGSSTQPNAGFGAIHDYDILNFALNLEYLEAEYYQRAAFGTTLSDADIQGKGNNSGSGHSGSGHSGSGHSGSGHSGSNVTPGTVTGVNANPANDKVPFSSPIIEQYAQEIANDELTHVRLLRSALGDRAVARPTIDIGPAFSAAAVAAGIIQQGQTFNPYANQTNFLLGAFVFEDVGVTAYRGALSLLNVRGNISVAGGLLGVEAYHASEVRTILYGLAASAPNSGLFETVQKISDLRDAADGNGSGAGNGVDDDDQGLLLDGRANIVPTDANGLVYARTLQQVLNIVYLTTATLGTTNSGGFFPNGLFGRIR